jgi:hypothetical protein
MQAVTTIGLDIAKSIFQVHVVSFPLHADEGWRLRQPSSRVEGSCLPKIVPTSWRELESAKLHPCRFRISDLRPGHRSGREPDARPRDRNNRAAVLWLGRTDLHPWPSTSFERYGIAAELNRRKVSAMNGVPWDATSVLSATNLMKILEPNWRNCGPWEPPLWRPRA